MGAAVEGRLSFIVIRGDAGSGKTAVLRVLAERGAHVLDLEALASHRGSAFGGIGLPAQPTARTFAARLAEALDAAEGRPIFAEVEGAALGSLAVPPALVRHLSAADYLLLRAPFEARVARIVATYGAAPRAELITAVARIEPHIGRATAARAQAALVRGDVAAAVRAVLPYYDRAYAHQLASCPGRQLAMLDMDDSSVAATRCSAWIDETNVAT